MNNEELATRIKNGEKHLSGALFENCYALLQFHTNSLYRRYPERCAWFGITRDDIFQTLYFAFLAAVEAFDPCSGYKLSTYLGTRAFAYFGRMAGFGSKRQKQDMVNFSISTETPIGNGKTEDGDATIGDTLEDNSAGEDFDAVDGAIFVQQLREALDTEISKLPPAHADTIRKRFFDGVERQTLIEESGRSPSYITRLETESYSRLRRSTRLQRFRDEILDAYAHRHRGLEASRRDGSVVEVAVIRAAAEDADIRAELHGD